MEGSFERALEAIKNLKQEKIKISISCCLNKKNISCIDNIVRLGESIGVEKINFLGAISTGYNQDLIMSNGEKSRYASEIASLRKNTKIILKRAASLSTDEKDTCDGYRLGSLMLNPFGEVAFCCDTIGKGAIIGSLKDTALINIYKKALITADNLRKERLASHDQKDANKKFGCEFCNSMLLKSLRNEST
jgi:MoaA/NifB/PqqE/SkfB family radical SAM enzyme